jgi:hypothetical protein
LKSEKTQNLDFLKKGKSGRERKREILKLTELLQEKEREKEREGEREIKREVFLSSAASQHKNLHLFVKSSALKKLTKARLPPSFFILSVCLSISQIFFYHLCLCK